MLRSVPTKAALVASLLAAACQSAESNDAPSGLTYATPDGAAEALADAARVGSIDAFEPVLGPDAEELVGAEDGVALQNELDAFLEGYDAAHRVETLDASTAVLRIGDADWPFPIPLVRGDDGWSFDTAAGRDEILSRRIGRNELSAIEVCRAIGDAQAEYRDQFGAYTARFLSSDGDRDGLYWPTDESEPQSPLGMLVADAALDGYRPPEDGERTPYLGYHYRILVERGEAAPGGAGSYMEDGRLTGGYAVLAWPADHGSSGIMTFLMDHRGVLLERDLGARTDAIATEMQAYDPTLDWAVCVE